MVVGDWLDRLDRGDPAMRPTLHRTLEWIDDELLDDLEPFAGWMVPGPTVPGTLRKTGELRRRTRPPLPKRCPGSGGPLGPDIVSFAFTYACLCPACHAPVHHDLRKVAVHEPAEWRHIPWGFTDDDLYECRRERWHYIPRRAPHLADS